MGKPIKVKFYTKDNKLVVFKGFKVSKIGTPSKISNLNDLAKYVAEMEGLKDSQNIAQIKEITKWTLYAVTNLPYSKVATLLKRYEE